MQYLTIIHPIWSFAIGNYIDVQRLGFLYVAAIRDIRDTLNSVMFALLRHLLMNLLFPKLQSKPSILL